MDAKKPEDDQTTWPRRFRVSLDRDHLQEFSRSVERRSGHGIHQSVPITYPVSWLKLPQVEKAILESVGIALDDGSTILLHTEQLIEVYEELRADDNYLLEIERVEKHSEEVCLVAVNVLSSSGQIQVALKGTFLFKQKENVSR